MHCYGFIAVALTSLVVGAAVANTSHSRDVQQEEKGYFRAFIYICIVREQLRLHPHVV